MMGTENVTYPKGAADCASAKCSMDAGCRLESDGSWICICTQDLSIQRADGYCPRVVVAQYPRNTDDEDRFIRMWENESIKTWIMGNQSNSDENSLSSNNEWILVLTILVLMVIITVIAVSLIIMRRKKLARRRQQNCMMMDQLEGVVSTEQQNLGTKDGFILLREWIKLEEEIGQGCFGLVYRGRYRRPGTTDSETVAVKVLKTNNRAADECELIREAQTMATFSHPNILAALGIVFNEGIAGSTWLVFEYMSMGDLTHLLRTSTADSSLGADGNSPISLREIHLMSMAEQIASGMAYLSTQRFIHRDLACRNCLVNQLHHNNSSGAIYFIVKISDFGMSRDVYTTDYYRMGGSKSVLPVRWMSPESILYGTFTTKSDVWSYGVVLWEIFTMGAQPYYGHSNEEAVKLILDGVLLNMPESVPSVIQQIFDGCSKSLPVDRLTFHQIEDKLKADQQRRVPPRFQGSGCSYIIPNPINMLDGSVRSIKRMKVINDEGPAICRETEGNTQAAAASTLPVGDAYLQLVIHTDSTGENISINIASPDYA